MRTAKVNIGGKEYQLGYSLRAMFTFERLAQKPFALNDLQDEVLFLFCCFLVVDSDFCDTDFSKFVDMLDAYPDALNQLRIALASLTRKENLEESDAPADDKKKD